MKRALFVIGGAIVLIVIGYAVAKPAETPTNKQANTAATSNANVAAVNQNTNATAANTNSAAVTNSAVETGAVSFATPTKTPHWQESTPAHGEYWAAPPVNVLVDFDFDLGPGSTISVTKDGVEYTTGPVVIDANKLGLRRALGASMPDGRYDVAYTACWPDGSCHTGRFQFAIDSTRSADFTDRRGNDEVTVSLEDFSITPERVRIDRGTTVVWENNGQVGHYVNTDPHASHGYHLALNSLLLNTGDAYEYTFTQPGLYPYHCSAHEDQMRGTVLVE